MAKRKISSYQRHINRLFRQINRMETRYYLFRPDFKEELKKKSARQLSHLKTEWLYKQAKYVDIETGEIIPGTEGYKMEMKRRAVKAAQTRKEKAEPGKGTEADDVTLQEFESDFYGWLNSDTASYAPHYFKGDRVKYYARRTEAIDAEDHAKNMLSSLYEDAKANNKHGLAVRIRAHRAQLLDLLEDMQHPSDAEQINKSAMRLGEIIKGARLTMVESIGIEDMADFDSEY